EREIEAVQATVSGFEADMAAFFERLLAEEDPTQFATMAERLPEPPSFEGLVLAPVAPEGETVADDPEAVEAVADEAVTDEAVTEETEAVEATDSSEEMGTAETDAPVGEAEVGLIGDTPTGHELIGEGSYEGFEGEDGEVDREAAFAAIQAAAEAAASAEVAADAAARAEA